MIDWIRDLFNAAEAQLEAFARAISDRIAALYSWILAGLSAAKAAWGRFANALSTVRSRIIETVDAIKAALEWLIITYVPRKVKEARDALIKWATQVITAAVNGLKALVATLDRWAKAAIATVTNALAAFRKWATDKINATIVLLTKVATIVYNLLTVPQRLASWLVAAMARELWLYADRNADKIAAWARARSISFVTSNIARIEGIISRLL